MIQHGGHGGMLSGGPSRGRHAWPAWVRSDQDNLSGSVGLADAQSALWARRRSVQQFMVTDEAGRKKTADNEQTLRGMVEADGHPPARAFSTSPTTTAWQACARSGRR